MAIHPMLVTRIVDDPFACAKAVEQESWLLEGEIVRIALLHIDIPFNPNNLRVVVPILRLERYRIPAMPGVVLLDVGDVRASVCNGAIPARPRHRRGKKQLGHESQHGQTHEVQRRGMEPAAFSAPQTLQSRHQLNEDVHPGGERQHAKRVADAQSREQSKDERDTRTYRRAQHRKGESKPRHSQPKQATRDEGQPDHPEYLRHCRERDRQAVVSPREKRIGDA